MLNSSLSSTSTDNTITLIPATASIYGRAVNSDGRGLSRVLIVLTTAAGDVFYSQTNPFGYYKIPNIPTGNVTLNFTSKSSMGLTRTLFLSNDLPDLVSQLP
jgi:hypothetical protein